MGRREKATKKGSRRKLSTAEVRRQHAAELPDREAMSLVLPSTGGLPIVSTDPTGGYSAPATDYSGAAADTAASSTHDATTLAPSGTNVPGGTATSSSST
jgi:hypothetical protein